MCNTKNSGKFCITIPEYTSLNIIVIIQSDIKKTGDIPEIFNTYQSPTSGYPWSIIR